MTERIEQKRAASRLRDIAPDFALLNQNGAQVRLYDILERAPVVLYFYLRDATPG